MNQASIVALLFFTLSPAFTAADHICVGSGPQTPRDISQKFGTNTSSFNLAPSYRDMNLCNIHTHTFAEHKGPGFSISANNGQTDGFRCNDTAGLSQEELTDPTHGSGAFQGVSPGDTIEVHWVYSSCAVQPGQGLGSCFSAACANPQLRVEAQVFLLVDDPYALNFQTMVYGNTVIDGRHQAKALPTHTGTPIVFAGSTTGPKYTAKKCSPYQVTWSVRPNCAKLNIASLHNWAADGNIFNESHSHGVRALVTEPELLAPIN